MSYILASMSVSRSCLFGSMSLSVALCLVATSGEGGVSFCFVFLSRCGLTEDWGGYQMSYFLSRLCIVGCEGR